MMQHTNQFFPAINENVKLPKARMTNGHRLISTETGNPILSKQDISIALQEYTPEDGHRIRFVLRNRQKMFWSYPTKFDRDKELKRVYYELLD